MKIKPFILATFLTFPLLPNVANALTSEQNQKAYQQMQILQNNLLNGDVMGIFEQYPPSYLHFISRDMGSTSEEFLQRMQILSKIIPKDSDKEFICDWQKASVGKTSQRDYLIVPCQTSMNNIDNKVQKVPAYILLLTENQKWYAIPNVNIAEITKKLKYTYPDLANIQFP